MSGNNECAGFTLNVPVDAGSIADDGEAQELRVAVQKQDGSFESQTLTVEPGRSVTASFSFDESPGGVRVLVGPAKASAQELAKIQTVAVDVPGHRLRAAEYSVAPVIVSRYFWLWWRHWCRDFVIRGRVICADGSPVPGATVTAFDTDWFFWWSSQQTIASAITDIDGTFEIDFTWCCGLWPWWWWANRVWQLDPHLVEQVQAVIERDPGLKLARTTQQPSLSAFTDILAPDGAATKLRRPIGPHDIGQLDSVRSTLLQRLPASTELASLRVWPWVSWGPWWDCSPDVTFRVTQDCDAPNTVIVAEGIGATRYDIGQSTDVVLIANELACCRPMCGDLPCPEGHCIDIAHVCGYTLDAIGANFGAPAGPVGYGHPGAVVPGINEVDADRPFAGVVRVDNANIMLDVDYYAIEYREHGGPAWLPLPPGAALDFNRRWTAPPPVVTDPWLHGYPGFSFADRTVTAPTPGTANVVESREHWEATTGLPPGGYWDVNWFHIVTLDSKKIGLGEGTFDFRVVGYEDNGDGTVSGGEPLPVCASEIENGWVLTFNNRLDPDPAATGPCGPGYVTTCVTEPETAILHVRVGGIEASECGTVDRNGQELLEIDFVARDDAGYLASYGVQAHYGNGHVLDLLALVDGTADHQLTLLSGDHEGPTYGRALAQGAVAPYWSGGRMRLTLPVGEAFPEPCCYELKVVAYSRDIVNCDGNFPWQNTSEYSIGVGVCPPHEPHEVPA